MANGGLGFEFVFHEDEAEASCRFGGLVVDEVGILNHAMFCEHGVEVFSRGLLAEVADIDFHKSPFPWGHGI